MAGRRTSTFVDLLAAGLRAADCGSRASVGATVERLGGRGSRRAGHAGDPARGRCVGLALRRNPRRAHLLVSRVLGKHIPADPRLVHAAGLLLGELVRRTLAGRAAPSAAGSTCCARRPRGTPPRRPACARRLGSAAERPVRAGARLRRDRHRPRPLRRRRRSAGAALPALHPPPVPGRRRRRAASRRSTRHATDHLLLPADPALLAGDAAAGAGRRRVLHRPHRAEHHRAPCTRAAAASATSWRPWSTCARADDRRGSTAFAAELGAPGRRGRAGRRARSRCPRTSLEPRPRALPSAVAAVARRRAGPARRAAEPRRAAADRSAGPPGCPTAAGTASPPAHRRALEAALPAHRGAGSPRRACAGAAGSLVLGTEELMYAPLRLAARSWPKRGAGVEVRFSTTTRSPGPRRRRPRLRRSAAGWSSPPTTTPPTAPASATPTTCAGAGFDAVVAVVDSAADTPALHAPDGLLAALAAHARRVLLAVVPSYVPAHGTARAPGPCMLPEPLRGPAFCSLRARRGRLAAHRTCRRRRWRRRPRSARRRSRAAARTTPSRCRSSTSRAPQYQELFQRRARRPRPTGSRSAVGVGHRDWCSPSAAPRRRAGLAGPRRHPGRRPDAPLGAARARPRPAALRRLHRARPRHRRRRAALARRPPRPGRRRLRRRLDRQGRHHPRTGAPSRSSRRTGAASTRSSRCSPTPARCVRTYGTRDDFLIPSACLNSTVSGLVSRTVLRDRPDRPGRLPRREVLPRAGRAPTSPRRFLDAVTARFDAVADAVAADGRGPAPPDRAPTWEGWAAVERISEEYGIGDVNLVKPGVGETTRVLLRRVPWKVLARARRRRRPRPRPAARRAARRAGRGGRRPAVHLRRADPPAATPAARPAPTARRWRAT